MNYLKPLEHILEAADMQKMLAIKDELTKAWHTKQIFRTETEARHAVLNEFKFPTKASRYWQSVREQMAHFDALVQASFESRRLKLKMRALEVKLLGRKFADDHELLIERDELLYAQACNEQVIKDRVREVLQWSKIKNELDDGSFDTNDVNTHQKESLFKSVLNRAKMAPNDLSVEERLTIKGLLFSLGTDDVNREEFEKLIAPGKELRPGAKQ